MQPLRSKSSHARLAITAPVLALLALAAFGAGEREAHASGYLSARFGADMGGPHQANGYAVYYNPAALGGTKGTSITGDVSVAVRFASYERPVSALSPSKDEILLKDDYVKANTGKATLTNALPLPFVSLNTDFGGSKWLRGGLAVYIPFGGAANWTRNDKADNPLAIGAVDGVQRWHNISGQIMALYTTGALAVNMSEWGAKGFSAGINVSGIYHHVETVRARNDNGSDDTTSTLGKLVEGRSYVNASGFNMSVGAGIYYEPEDRAYRLGLSYTSQPGFGQTRMNGTLTQVFASSAVGGDQDIDFLQTYPDIVRFGYAQKFGKRWEIATDLEYVRWSVFNKQCVVLAGKDCKLTPQGDNVPGVTPEPVVLNIPRNWNDAFLVRVGPAYQASDRVNLFASMSVNTPAVPKSTIDASTIDALRIGVTAGVRWQATDHFALGFAYNHFGYFSVVSREGAQYTFARASKSPNASGTYSAQIALFNTNVSYTF